LGAAAGVFSIILIEARLGAAPHWEATVMPYDDPFEKHEKERAALSKTAEALQELAQSVPRAIAIVGCALLDDALRNALLRRFVKSESGHKKFWSDGPGHETSEKIYLAYTLGIIKEETRENLYAIATIRNKFAHTLHIRSFSHPDLKHILEKVTLYRRLREETGLLRAVLPDPIPEHANPQERFIGTVGYIHAMFSLDPWNQWVREPERPMI
jgi:hypothetical protein